MGTLVALRMVAELENRVTQVLRNLGFVMRDPDDSAEQFKPHVTSADSPSIEMGRAAANLLNVMLLHAPSATTRIMLLARSSTPGPAKTSVAKLRPGRTQSSTAVST